jgi:hypothetical protein
MAYKPVACIFWYFKIFLNSRLNWTFEEYTKVAPSTTCSYSFSVNISCSETRCMVLNLVSQLLQGLHLNYLRKYNLWISFFKFSINIMSIAITPSTTSTECRVLYFP